jgi:hypothetical protein
MDSSQATSDEDEVFATPQTLLKFETDFVAAVASHGRALPDDGTEVMFDISFPKDSNPAGGGFAVPQVRTFAG